MARSLASVLLPADTVARLHQAGYDDVDDVLAVAPSALARDTGLSHEAAVHVLQQARGPGTGNASAPVRATSGSDANTEVSALELLQRERARQPIFTFSDSLDGLLDGGVPVGRVTEFCGVPGIGKTQLGMQLAVNVQVDSVFGGLAGAAVYIDTEGSLVPERLADIADALVTHVRDVASSPAEHEAAARMSVASILGRIHVYRVHDVLQQLAVLHVLPGFLKQHPQVRLVLIDSVTFHFRHGFTDMAHRSRLLAGMAQQLTSMAQSGDVAVVLMNQVTTRVHQHRDSSDSSYVVPALGEAWSHACACRVMLYWRQGSRYARLDKSSNARANSVAYRVCSGGIRDLDDADDTDATRAGEHDHHPHHYHLQHDDAADAIIAHGKRPRSPVPTVRTEEPTSRPRLA